MSTDPTDNGTSTAADQDSSSSSSGLPGFAIVLIITGVIAAALFIAATVVRWRRKNRNRRLQSFHVDFDDTDDLFNRPRVNSAGSGAKPDLFHRDLGQYHRQGPLDAPTMPQPVAQPMYTSMPASGAAPQMFGDAAYHPQYPHLRGQSPPPPPPFHGPGTGVQLAEPVLPPSHQMSHLRSEVDYNNF